MALVLVGLAGYSAVQFARLARGVESLESARLQTRREASGRAEGLARQLALARGVLQSRGVRVSVARAGRADLGEARAPSVPDMQSFLTTQLFPEDARIAGEMLRGTPIAEIARRTGRAEAFILAKGARILSALESTSETPPAALKSLRGYLEDPRQSP